MHSILKFTYVIKTHENEKMSKKVLEKVFTKVIFINEFKK